MREQAKAGKGREKPDKRKGKMTNTFQREKIRSKENSIRSKEEISNLVFDC